MICINTIIIIININTTAITSIININTYLHQLRITIIIVICSGSWPGLRRVQTS